VEHKARIFRKENTIGGQVGEDFFRNHLMKKTIAVTTRSIPIIEKISNQAG